MNSSRQFLVAAFTNRVYAADSVQPETCSGNRWVIQLPKLVTYLFNGFLGTNIQLAQEAQYNEEFDYNEHCKENYLLRNLTSLYRETLVQTNVHLRLALTDFPNSQLASANHWGGDLQWPFGSELQFSIDRTDPSLDIWRGS